MEDSCFEPMSLLTLPDDNLELSLSLADIPVHGFEELDQKGSLESSINRFDYFPVPKCEPTSAFDFEWRDSGEGGQTVPFCAEFESYEALDMRSSMETRDYSEGRESSEKRSSSVSGPITKSREPFSPSSRVFNDPLELGGEFDAGVLLGESFVPVGPFSSMPSLGKPPLGPKRKHSQINGPNTAQKTPLKHARSEDILRLGRRLKLEYTFVQWNENNVESALKAFREARSLQSRMPTCQDFALRMAIGLNSARYNLGTVNSQIESALIRGILKNGEGPAWRQFLPGQLTAVRAMESMASGKHLEEKRRVHFNIGPWAGLNVEFAQIQTIAKAQRWEIMAPVLAAKLNIAECLIQRMEKVPAHDAVYEKLASLAARLFSDYWTVNVILTFTSYIEGEKDAPFRLLAPNTTSFPCEQMLTVMEKIQLSKDQLHQVKRLRQCSKELLDRNTAYEEQLTLRIEHLFGKNPSQENDTDVLDTVERLRLVKLEFRELQVEIVHTFLFGILTPRQAAYLHISIALAKSVAHWTDWMLIFCNAIVSFKHNSWIDRCRPTTILGYMHL